MDEEKRNIRLVRSEGRRVKNTTTEYDWSSLEKRMPRERKTSSNTTKRPSASKNRPKKRRDVSRKQSSPLEQRISYQKRQKNQRVKRQRIKAILVLIAAVIIVVVILFMTPLFNIRSINVEGNNFVTQEQLTEVLKPLVGKNVLLTGGKKINGMLKIFPYIDNAKVDKSLFPPTLKIAISEYRPSAMIISGDKKIIVTSNLHVLSDDGTSPVNVPTVRGVEISKYKTGEDIKIDDDEKTKVLSSLISAADSTNITDKIIEIDMNDMNNIKMNYDNRLTVLCGSQLDIERKIRLFKEAVTSNSLAADARGTMDLSDIGKAVYTP